MGELCLVALQTPKRRHNQMLNQLQMPKTNLHSQLQTLLRLSRHLHSQLKFKAVYLTKAKIWLKVLRKRWQDLN